MTFVEKLGKAEGNVKVLKKNRRSGKVLAFVEKSNGERDGRGVYGGEQVGR